NGDIGGWKVENVTDMAAMFANASSFNRDIGGWNVENVATLSYMFSGASSFNRDIGGWDVGNVTDMSGMFLGAALSTANYDALLNGWSALALQSGVNFNAGNSTYCAGEAARADIISNFGWATTDGGGAPGCILEIDYF